MALRMGIPKSRCISDMHPQVFNQCLVDGWVCFLRQVKRPGQETVIQSDNGETSHDWRGEHHWGRPTNGRGLTLVAGAILDGLSWPVPGSAA